MKDKLLYIAQKKWMKSYPEKVTKEILKSNTRLYDQLLMQKVIENEELDDKPYYNLERQEVLLEK